MSALIDFFLWKLRLKSAETQTSIEERGCLARHVRARERVVEIGVWHGVTTCVLRNAMSSGGVLFAVDPYPTGRLGFSTQKVIAHNEVRRKTTGRVEWLQMTGLQASVWMADKPMVDFIFIDGDHSYEGLEGDWYGWAPLVKNGGIIALHDSVSSSTRNIEDAGSAIFTRDLILTDQRFRLIEQVDTLTVVRKLN
jgi:predicted O-methyltransferase YrrM